MSPLPSKPDGDDIEEKVGTAVVVVEVSDRNDREKLVPGEAVRSPGRQCAGVLRGEFLKYCRGNVRTGSEAIRRTERTRRREVPKVPDRSSTPSCSRLGYDKGQRASFRFLTLHFG